METLTKQIIYPQQITRLFNPQQIAVVIIYGKQNGRRQTWLMCDQFPFHVFILPEKRGYQIPTLLDLIDQHFDNVVHYPSQLQFVKAIESRRRLAAQKDIDKWALFDRGVDISKKVILIGAKILVFLSKEVGLSALFIIRKLIILFSSLLSNLVDSYNSIPNSDAGKDARRRAELLNAYGEQLDTFDTGLELEHNLPRFKKLLKDIRNIISDQMDDSKEYLYEFEEELKSKNRYEEDSGVRR